MTGFPAGGRSLLPALSIVAWSAFWIAAFAIGVGTDGVGLWALLVVPNFLLGFATGRWWTATLPFALVALVPLYPDETCVNVDCGEAGAIPAWVVVLTYVAPRGAVAVIAGVAARRWIGRARRRRRRGPPAALR